MNRTLTIDGRKVYIVRSPDEAASLKKTNSKNDDTSEDIEWHLHGSPGHLDTLRRAHELNAERVDALRKRDPSKYEEYEKMRDERDALSHELHNLTASDPDLQENFDRYGYRPHIRIYDDDREPIGDNGPVRESTTMKLYSRPYLRQYFHDGFLYRTRRSEDIMSFELFVDLLYVGIIGINGDKALEDPTGQALLKFCVTFIPSWRIWTDVGQIVSYFTTEDILQRYVVLAILALLVGYTTNITSAFYETYESLIVYFLCARVVVMGVVIRMAITLPHVRPFMAVMFFCILIPCAFWTGSIFLHDATKEALIWLAIIGDTFGSGWALLFVRMSGGLSERLAIRSLGVFDYYPAMNIEHKVERTGAFISLVFGYSVVALLFQQASSSNPNGFYGKAVLGLVQAYGFNTIYFDIDAKYLETHALRRSAWSGSIWLNMHLPLILMYTIAGAALSKLVVASDCFDTNIESLTEMYQEKSISEIPDGLRWFYCGGFGGALLCMVGIAASHTHYPVNAQRLRKRTRLIFRTAVATCWILLPLAKSLNSLCLIAITSSLTILVLAVDIYGMSSAEESFIGREEHFFKADDDEENESSEKGEKGKLPEKIDQGGAVTKVAGNETVKVDRRAAAASRKFSVFMA